MPQIKTEPYLRLELTVDTKVISEYGLESVLLSSYKVNHPCEHVMIPHDGIKTIDFPYTFPPLFPKHSADYLEDFVKLYKGVAKDIDEKHYDNILFLAYSYFLASEKRIEKTHQEDAFRKRGQLLLEFIKVPIPIFNASTIENAFDEEDLYYSSMKDYLLMYLGIAAQKRKPNFFLTNPKDPNSNIDLSKIDKSLWIEVSRRIQIDKNISIIIDEREIANRKSRIKTFEKRYLTVSKDIQLNFQHIIEGSVQKGFKAEAHYQNNHLLKILVQELFNEQKTHETDLYYAIMNHDFIVDTDYRALVTAAGTYNRLGSHYLSLKKLHDVLIKYFDDNSILIDSSSKIQNRKRNDFIYQFLLLVNLKNTPYGNKSEKESSKQEDNLTNSINEFRRKKVGYATKALADMFYNNRRNNKVKDLTHGQSLRYF